VPCGLNIAAQIAGLIGVGLLAVPVFYVAHYGYLSAKLAGARRTLHPGWQTAVTNTVAQLDALKDSWDWKRFAALVAGTLAAALSYVLGFIALFACG
jgi:hypothetical protein